jgi:hypothetical protein
LHTAAIAIDLVLGLVEFVVINRALREWTGTRGWAVVLLALAATYVPAVGGGIACIAAIMVLDWPWWIACGTFVGGTTALILTGGIAAVLGQGSVF